LYNGGVRAVRHLTLAAVCFAALAWTGTASALIVPQRSIAGIELDMTRAEVRALKGEPRRIERGTNEFGRYTIFRYGRLWVSFQGNAGATAVFTRRPRQRTAEGIGVGSTEAELRETYNVRCRTELGTFRHCWTGRFRPGRRVTDYRIDLSSRLITGILIGYVID
jgi:hypothetical protein